MFKQRHLIRFMILLMPLFLLGCFATTRGNGNVVSESRDHDGFTAVMLTTSFDVVLTQDESFSVVVEADENLLALIDTSVENGRLRIDSEPNMVLVPTEPIRVHVSMPTVEALSISGSGDITAPTLSAETLTTSVSGSGTIEMGEVTAVFIDADISGSGDILLTGETEGQDVAISGSGEFEGERLQSETAVVRISGSGAASVWVMETLDATITGSGSISHVGNPTIESRITGSGNINQADG